MFFSSKVVGIPGPPSKQSGALQYLGRALMALIFLSDGALKFGSFDKETGGPFMAHLSPKLETAVAKLENGLGIRIPLKKVCVCTWMLCLCELSLNTLRL